jgi:hypothetical protein
VKRGVTPEFVNKSKKILYPKFRVLQLGMCVLRNPKSLHIHKINHLPPCKHLHQLKMRIKLKIMMMKIKRSHLKRRTMIKGEMLMIKTRKMMRVQDRHTQESIKQYNEITP